MFTQLSFQPGFQVHGSDGSHLCDSVGLVRYNHPTGEFEFGFLQLNTSQEHTVFGYQGRNLLWSTIFALDDELPT